MLLIAISGLVESAKFCTASSGVILGVTCKQKIKDVLCMHAVF